MSASITDGKASSAKATENEEDSDYRIYSVISYFIVLVVIGLPIWWYTTRVYRASLPETRMQEVQIKNYTEKEYGMPLSLEYDILISFVHPDPLNPQIELKGVDIEQYLNPYLEKISPIAEFIIKSQWLYLIDLGITPVKLNNHFVLKEDQLPHIITPLESKLWSHMSPRPTINLVVYFAPCDDHPLYIYDKNNQKVETNAFLSPRWGGLLVVNSDKASCEKGILKPNLNSITSVFVTQLQKLFKVDDISDADNIYELKMRKATEMIESTHRTLRSLAELLSEIKSIVISEDVGEKISVAVDNADLAQEFLEKDVDQGLKYAKVAFKNSEEAFSDPSLLSLLYFPEDQKYAVYIPLFLPIMIPVFMSLFTLRKWIFKKKEKIE
ncbi:GPI transamidase component PIG-S [Diabrotica undecimpunctata]|uniref:GPI transamidase component PIG-S n=1 Tax=Diabrotica undecimpunctata TaxID=50387 RepID=UPI003B634EBE